MPLALPSTKNLLSPHPLPPTPYHLPALEPALEAGLAHSEPAPLTRHVAPAGLAENEQPRYRAEIVPAVCLEVQGGGGAAVRARVRESAALNTHIHTNCALTSFPGSPPKPPSYVWQASRNSAAPRASCGVRIFSILATASTVYVPRESISPPKCMEKPPDSGSFMHRKKRYSAGRSIVAYASCVPRVHRAKTAAYVGAQWEICPGPPENPPTLAEAPAPAPAPAPALAPAASAVLFCMCASVLTILCDKSCGSALRRCRPCRIQ